MKNHKAIQFIACFAFLLAFACQNVSARSNLDQALSAAAQHCERTTSPSRMGSCMEMKLTENAPSWTSSPYAAYVATLFPYANTAGEKLESGEWDRQRYEYEVVAFVNRLKIQIAEAGRLRSPPRESAVQAFVNGFNSGIRCIVTGPIIRCR